MGPSPLLAAAAAAAVLVATVAAVVVVSAVAAAMAVAGRWTSIRLYGLWAPGHRAQRCLFVNGRTMLTLR